MVLLPTLSPRMGLQTSIMFTPKVDLLIKVEHVLSSVNLGNWTYAKEQEDNVEESRTWNANWIGSAPEIIYSGWIFSLGLKITSFSSYALY